MAEERNLGVARAPEADEDHTKAELQRRMEEARESITQTVTEIKDTVANQYNSVRESVTDALDWREQFRKRPVAWSVGALGVGFVVGYSLGGAIPASDEDEDYPAYSETDAFELTGASAAQAAGDSRSTPAGQQAYAVRALAGGAYGSSEYAAAPEQMTAPRPSYSSGYDQATAAAEEEDKPGLIERVKESALLERFKETRAYDRLQEEVSELCNRFMDELSNAARTIVLPALFNKIKELVGVDLSNKQQSGATKARLAYGSEQSSPQATASASQGTVQAANASQSSTTGTGAQASSPGASESRSKFDSLADERTPASAAGSEVGNRSGDANYDDRYERESQLYARSENRGFGTQARGGESPKSANVPASGTREDTGSSNT
jgi:hypothetical protein